MDFAKKIGMQIKNRREELGLTQDQLAESMGLNNHRSISLWENGKAPKIENIEKLSKALKCDPERLLGFVKYPTVTTSWIAEHIPLNGAAIDELRKLKMECDERKNIDVLGDEALLTQCLAETVVLYMIRDQEHDGVNETLLSLVYRLIGALKILAEYEAPHIKGKDFVFGSDGISAEELTEMKRNPPERYRMANWEKEMCEKNIGELLAQHISDLLKSHIEIAEIIERSESNGEK